MAKGKEASIDVWTAGIDPGLGCTGVVLCNNYEPVAGRTFVSTNVKDPMVYRTRSMMLGVKQCFLDWIFAFKIKELHVVTEQPVLNVSRTTRCPTCGQSKAAMGVQSLIKQAWMYGAYQLALFEVAQETECVIYLGDVANTQVKQAATGNGNASKNQVIDRSAWAKRPDITQRNHLADAQAMAKCFPAFALIHDELPKPTFPAYLDDAIGKGPVWKGKL